jgi:hypothetical protein
VEREKGIELCMNYSLLSHAIVESMDDFYTGRMPEKLSLLSELLYRCT